MFVGLEVPLDVSFASARARFAESVRDGWLTEASGRAHADGLCGLIRVGPFGAVLGASKLVRVQVLEPVPRGDSVMLPVRWEAIGVTGRLFPVFDADLVLTRTDSGKTLVALQGVYRAPLAGVGSGLDRLVLHRVAMATVRSLLRRIAEKLAEPDARPEISTRNSAAGIAKGSLPQVVESESPS